MKNITHESVSAFYARKNFKKANMQVIHSENGSTRMYLHGNCIAILDNQNKLYITNAGWQSKTTKERLNALKSVSIYQKNWQWYLNGRLWDGGLTLIK